MSNFTQHIPPPCHEAVTEVFVDEHIVVVNKPSGLLSVPGRYVKDCALHRVLFDYADATVVHRLDLDTSGLLIFVRSRLAARELSKAFRERRVKKEYIAVVWGIPDQQSGVINVGLSPHPSLRPRHVVDEPGGKEAITRYEVISTENGCARVLLRPDTGRSHQLRVHLAHIGHPILGCDLYAHETAFKAASRLQLHASRLSFAHPLTGEPVTLSSSPAF